eukprot:7650557-Pyramimonas_sp.AAC.2
MSQSRGKHARPLGATSSTIEHRARLEAALTRVLPLVAKALPCAPVFGSSLNVGSARADLGVDVKGNAVVDVKLNSLDVKDNSADVKESPPCCGHANCPRFVHLWGKDGHGGRTEWSGLAPKGGPPHLPRSGH